MLIAAATAVVTGAGVSPAVASWYAVQSGPGTGGASAASVNVGPTPTVSVSNKNSAAASWSTITMSTGAAVGGYFLTRYNTAGVVQTMANCGGAISTTSCTETNIPDGTWTYSVAGRYSGWIGKQSPKSAPFVTDTTPPVNHLSLTSVTGGAFMSGTTVYFRGVNAGSLSISNAMTDAGSGPAGSNDGALGNAPGWTHTAQAVTTPTGGPYVTNPYSWTAGTTAQPQSGFAGYDMYGNNNADTVQFTLDNDAPTGGTISYADGAATSKTVAVTLGTVTDSGSGVVASNRLLQKSSAPLDSSGTCGTWSSFSTVVVGPTSPQAVPVTTGSCYRFQYVVTDNVGNTTTSTSASVVKLPTYSSVVLSTASLISQWRLDDAAGSTVVADTGPAANSGTWSGGPTLGSAGALAGDADTAVTFDGVDDYGRATRQIGDNFTVELWMKTTAGKGVGTNWFNGAGLVDADVSGVKNDFGMAILANGKIIVGTGSPDTSATSPASYADGAWHHVVMTRTLATGAVVLYVDGAQVATATGGTQSLTAPVDLNFGRVQTGAYFAGSLDEIAVYSAALTPAQVQAHYLAGAP